MNAFKANRKFSFPITTLLGSSIPNFIKACKGYTIEPKYYFRIIISFIVALVFELLAAWEKLRWNRKLNATKITKTPVFVIGFWRSGTTLLHNLLCQDPDTAYVTTFHTVFPNLVLSQKWIKSVTNFFLPESRPFDDYAWSMDSPQEEEFALSNVQPYSFYKFFLFPRDFDRILKDELPFSKYPANRREVWKKQYLKLIRKAMLDQKGSRYIGKNPCNIYRVESLMEMFPDAKFIFIYRNPYKVVESLYGFSHSIIRGIQLQDSKGLPDRERIVRLYCESINEYFKVREKIAPGNLMEFPYEEMQKDIPGMIKKIYTQFGMDNFDSVLPKIQSYIDSSGMEKRQPLDIPGETYTLLNQNAPDVFKALGYKMVRK